MNSHIIGSIRAALELHELMCQCHLNNRWEGSNDRYTPR